MVTGASAGTATGVAGLASSVKAGVSGDSSSGDSSVGVCSIGDGDSGSIGDSCVCDCSVVVCDGNGSIGDGSNDNTSGNCGDCGGGNVSKVSWSPRR